MMDFDTDQIVGALALIALILFLVLPLRRKHLRQTIQSGAIWALIFVGTVAGFGIWQDIQQDVMPKQAAFADQGRIEVPRHRDGHYYLTLDINGSPVDFVVDTGASEIVLTKEDAEKAGLSVADLNFFGRANTANGEVRTAPVRLDTVNLGGISDSDVPAYVNEGEMFQSLLGMAYLHRWDKLEIADGLLILTRAP